MIVHDFDVERIAAVPVEAKSPLLVDTDTVLSLAVAAKLFEPVAGARQVAQFLGPAKDSQLAQRRALEIMREARRPAAIENRLRIGVGKAPNHVVLSVMHTTELVNPGERPGIERLVWSVAGVEALRAACEASDIPVYALGGITGDRLR